MNPANNNCYPTVFAAPQAGDALSRTFKVRICIQSGTKIIESAFMLTTRRPVLNGLR
jgi:hypothetical protein